MLEDLSGQLSAGKQTDLIERLENKRVEQSLPAQIELALVWAIGQHGDLERTQAGLKRAEAKGRRLGRKPKLGGQQRRDICRRIDAGELTQADAARLLGVSKATICRPVARG